MCDGFVIRDPTTDEMVKGISRAVKEHLDSMEFGVHYARPALAFPRGFREGAEKAIGQFLERHKFEIIRAIADRAQGI